VRQIYGFQDIREGVRKGEESFKLGVKTAERIEVVKFRETGLSYAEIGRKLGMSRQRAWQIAIGKPKRVPRPKVMLTIGDVASYLGVHPNTVRVWSEKGILKSYRIGPRQDRRFRREDIDDFLGLEQSEKRRSVEASPGHT